MSLSIIFSRLIIMFSIIISIIITIIIIRGMDIITHSYNQHHRQHKHHHEVFIMAQVASISINSLLSSPPRVYELIKSLVNLNHRLPWTTALFIGSVDVCDYLRRRIIVTIVFRRIIQIIDYSLPDVKINVKNGLASEFIRWRLDFLIR